MKIINITNIKTLKLFKLNLLASFVLFFCLILVGCGFYLRGTQPLPDIIKQLTILPDTPNDRFQRGLRRSLNLLDVQIVPPSQASSILTILQAGDSTQVLARAPDGSVSSIAINYSVTFSLTTSDFEPLITNQTINLTRTLPTSDDVILSKSQEQTVIINELRQDAANQIIRVLESVQAPDAN